MVATHYLKSQYTKRKLSTTCTHEHICMTLLDQRSAQLPQLLPVHEIFDDY